MEPYQPHPLRVQLRRTKGWRKPEGAIVVARPGKWGNPFTAQHGDPVKNFREWLSGILAKRDLRDMLAWNAISEEARYIAEDMLDQAMERRLIILAEIDQLRGKQLCCWCSLAKPCHADVLAELANR